MRSPFPGMDPWLEAHWRDVHSAFVIYARDAIVDQLPADLVARVEEGLSVESDEYTRVIAPNVRVVENPSIALGSVAPTASGTAIAEPLIVPTDEPATERRIEILDVATGHRVVTVIEVLSPSNKIPYDGREKYLQKQQEYLAGGVNLVEIDLIRDGIFTVATTQKNIPERRRTPYLVCVRRRVRLGDAEVYPIPLRETLPTIHIPLRPSDGDITLNLQQIMETCHIRGRYAATLRYDAPPDPPLEGDDARWADEILRTAGYRK